MNIALWILQILLALHTAAGAFWKFSNSAAQTMPSLSGIPDPLWISLAIVELLCCVGLVAPAVIRTAGPLAPAAAGLILAEMLLFTFLHLASGAADLGPIGYWLVVAALCGFLVYGRVRLAPLAPGAGSRAQ